MTLYAATAHTHDDLSQPLWIVTFPTVTCDGRSGTHSFVVTAPSVQAAIATARGASSADDAKRHRRHASSVSHAATVREVAESFSGPVYLHVCVAGRSRDRGFARVHPSAAWRVESMV
ncbi:hypothetical protein [Streptomyces sp. CA-106131]|uniref:hypothetical protein n=1 Tax=Streptomyces sp. CA-106131 TaxID=3240045 RepID=UPI003D928E8A